MYIYIYVINMYTRDLCLEKIHELYAVFALLSL